VFVQRNTNRVSNVGDEDCIKNSVEGLNERDHLRNIGVNGVTDLQIKHVLRVFGWIQLADGRNVW